MGSYFLSNALTLPREAARFASELKSTLYKAKAGIRSQLTGTMARERNDDLLEDPLRLENDSDPRRVTRPTDLMGRSLDDTEHRLASETKAPPVRIDVLGDILRPRLRIQLGDAVKHLPVRVVVLVN